MIDNKRNAKLVKLLNGVDEMKLGDYQDNTIDTVGDAYKYLIAAIIALSTNLFYHNGISTLTWVLSKNKRRVRKGKTQWINEVVIDYV